MIGAFLVIFSCRTLLYTIARDPDIAIFVEMKGYITKSIFKFFVSYIWIFIGWVVAFHVTLGNFTPASLNITATKTIEAESFSDLGSSILKVLTMFTGELGFDATFAHHVQFTTGNFCYRSWVKYSNGSFN